MSDREYFFMLPFPPSLNILAGKRYPPKIWKETKLLAAQVSHRTAEEGPMMGSISVEWRYSKGDLKRYDIENCSKAIADGFTMGGLWIDDYQIDVSHCERLPVVKDRPGLPGGCVYVLVKEIGLMSRYDLDKAKFAKKPKKKKKEA